MPKKLDPEILAIQKIVRAMKPLDGATIARVLRYLIQRYTYSTYDRPKHAESRAE